MDLDNLAKFISFKSISTDSRYDDELKECCKWLANYLSTFCDQVKIFDTAGKPVILAFCGDGSPVIQYGHYDVQPASLSDGWNTDPFCLVEKNGRIYARGAQDNKGQLWYAIQAVKTLKSRGLLKGKVIFFIEGEEESGGHGSHEFLKKNGKDLFKDAKVAYITDSGGLTENIESVTVGVRGIGTIELILKGAGYDLHSGVHGGLAPNPIFCGAKLLSNLSPENYSKITGFLDEYKAPTEEELKIASNFNLSGKAYSDLLKLQKPINSLQVPFLAIGLIPRIECIGFHGGYSGDGIKNIIPSSCRIKLSVRTAFDQKTENALSAIVNYIKQLDLESAVEVVFAESHGNPVKIQLENEDLKNLIRIIEEVTGHTVLPQWCGASIPIVEVFSSLNLTPLMFGFGLEEDQIHGPNESFSLSQFEKGFRVMLKIFGG